MLFTLGLEMENGDGSGDVIGWKSFLRAGWFLSMNVADRHFCKLGSKVQSKEPKRVVSEIRYIAKL